MSEENAKELSKQEYWDGRYGQRDEHEWFMEYVDLQELFTKLLPSAQDCPQLLHLGCGTSTLTRDLYEVGYTQQLNVDFSPEAIHIMQDRYSRNGIEWRVVDVRKMESIGDSTIDVAIDKGTLDAFLHGSLFDPPDDVQSNVTAYIDEVARVLRPGGTFIYVTFRSPLFMRKFVERPGVWSLETHKLEKAAGSFEYCLYYMVKEGS